LVWLFPNHGLWVIIPYYNNEIIKHTLQLNTAVSGRGCIFKRHCNKAKTGVFCFCLEFHLLLSKSDFYVYTVPLISKKNKHTAVELWSQFNGILTQLSVSPVVFDFQCCSPWAHKETSGFVWTVVWVYELYLNNFQDLYD